MQWVLWALGGGGILLGYIHFCQQGQHEWCWGQDLWDQPRGCWSMWSRLRQAWSCWAIHMPPPHCLKKLLLHSVGIAQVLPCKHNRVAWQCFKGWYWGRQQGHRQQWWWWMWLEFTKEYLRSHLGVVRVPLAYIIRKAITVQTFWDNLKYATPNDEMIDRYYTYSQIRIDCIMSNVHSQSKIVQQSIR